MTKTSDNREIVYYRYERQVPWHSDDRRSQQSLPTSSLARLLIRHSSMNIITTGCLLTSGIPPVQGFMWD